MSKYAGGYFTPRCDLVYSTHTLGNGNSPLLLLLAEKDSTLRIKVIMTLQF